MLWHRPLHSLPRHMAISEAHLIFSGLHIDLNFCCHTFGLLSRNLKLFQVVFRLRRLQSRSLADLRPPRPTTVRYSREAAKRSTLFDSLDESRYHGREAAKRSTLFDSLDESRYHGALHDRPGAAVKEPSTPLESAGFHELEYFGATDGFESSTPLSSFASFPFIHPFYTLSSFAFFPVSSSLLYLQDTLLPCVNLLWIIKKSPRAPPTMALPLTLPCSLTTFLL
jgi:hypothetical protein